MEVEADAWTRSMSFGFCASCFDNHCANVIGSRGAPYELAPRPA
jgi:hypothetical protein